MVCVVCNGKGYVIEKHRELVCSECQGRGECFLCDSNMHIGPSAKIALRPPHQVGP